MTYRQISARAFSLWAFLAGLEGFLALYFIAREPSEAESALAFGLSLQRLLIASVVLCFALFFVTIALAHFFRLLAWNESINRKPGSIRYLLAGFLILELVVLHVLFFMPEYHFPTLLRYLPRLRPALVWLALVFAQTLIFLAYYRGLSFERLHGWRGKNPALIAVVAIGLTWGFVALTGIGITPGEFYWNVAGVPILAGQVWIAIGITGFAWFLYQTFVTEKGIPRAVSFAIFIGIWVIAAIVWINTPLGPTFNAPGPYPPSREFYPFVDAALFDLGAQSAIYGKGFFYGTFLDRGLLSGFLTLIHKTFGQNYLVVVGVQSAVYAVFPAILYLLGKKVHSISVGVMVATLAILKVSNGITGGRWISTSHPKLLLTEFPTGIVLVLFSLFMVKWLRAGNSRAYYLAGVGACIGIGILLRHTVLAMFPVMFLIGLAVWRLRLKVAVRDLFLFILAFFITISPWMWRNQQIAGLPFFFMPHLNRVIEERYETQSQLESNQRISGAPLRGVGFHAAKSPVEPAGGIDLDQYQFIPKHFVHNVVTSVLILPPSPILDDFRHVIDNYPYWDRIENSTLGDISIPMGVFLAVNLIILSVGIGVAWKRVKFAALVPLLVFLFYNLASAFARTSGGRYIVPVDWVVYFYYAIGLIEIIRFCISTMGFHANGFFENTAEPRLDQESARVNWMKAGLVVLPFFLIVTSLPLLELASPGEKPLETTESLLEQLDEKSFFEGTGFSRQDVEGFLENPDALLLSGRGFYPRYYSYDQGEPILPGQMSVYTAREYPRLVFTLLLPNGERPVLLPIDERNLYFPDAAEVIVGGCPVGQSTVFTSYLNYIDAAFVAIMDETATVYVRVPGAPLTCPLREPVCDNNHNCE